MAALLAMPSHSDAAPEAASRATSPALRVEFRHGLLSLEAKQAPWSKLLEVVSRQTAIRLRVNVPLEGSVTASFKEVPIERALRQLFGPDADFVLLYHDPHVTRAPGKRLTEVWVFGRAPEASRTRATRDRNDGPVASTGQEAEKWFATSPQAARDAALSASDPETRLAAIASLGQRPDPQAVGTLLEIIEHRDPHMRQSALDALAPLLGSDPGVREGLGRLMRTAEDPEVRQLAADSLGIPLAHPVLRRQEAVE